MTLWRENVSRINLTLPETQFLPSNASDGDSELYPLGWVLPVTVVYGIIFITGLLGNISTCFVIHRNKSMHTATNYYLFSLAVSDLLLLISGLPPEMYRIWSPETYVFGEAFCVLQGFAAETSANATVLTITAFTVERYVAICHPFLSHTIAKLSRIVKFIVVIWIAALCLAAPQAIQFGVEYEFKDGMQYSTCTVVTNIFEHAFEISTFVFFVGPMTLITVLYVLIAIKLRKSRLLTSIRRASQGSGAHESGISRTSRGGAAQNRVIKMLVAVVAAFFLCWAPFHAQRLLAVYLSNLTSEAPQMLISIYIALNHISGVLYFLSTTINPVLYHIMSNKFREAFKSTLKQFCNRGANRDLHIRTYSMLSRYPPSVRTYQRSVSDGVQNIRIPKTLDMTSKRPNKDQCQRSAPASRQTSTNNFHARLLSESSQTTVLTNISKSTSTDGSNKSRKTSPAETNSKNEHPRRNICNQEKIDNTSFWNKCTEFFKIYHNFKEAENSVNNDTVDNANTISNSSLQDMDEIEFSSSDLVRYMEEVNEDLT